MNITKITIGRLYNLGNYEHVRYELTVDVGEGESASTALAGIERIFAALNPKETGNVPTESDIRRSELQVENMKERLAKGREDFDRYYGHDYAGTPEEYIARCEQSCSDAIKRRAEWQARSRKARQLLDDLGGAAKWEDAKLEWDDNDF